MLRISDHTACRFRGKNADFPLTLEGRYCAPPRVSPFFKVETIMQTETAPLRAVSAVQATGGRAADGMRSKPRIVEGPA